MLTGRRCAWIGPDEDGPSDDGEELSVNTESGADTTDQDLTESFGTSNPQPTQDAIPSSRTRASNLAATRGLGIRVESSDGQRPLAGLPGSPRPPARSPRGSSHAQEGGTSGTSAPSQ